MLSIEDINAAIIELRNKDINVSEISDGYTEEEVKLRIKSLKNRV